MYNWAFIGRLLRITVVTIDARQWLEGEVLVCKMENEGPV